MLLYKDLHIDKYYYSFSFLEVTDSNFGFELQVSPEQSVMHKNGFAKLATLCGVNLWVEKTQAKRNIKEELSFFNYALKEKNWKFDEFWCKYEKDSNVSL